MERHFVERTSSKRDASSSCSGVLGAVLCLRKFDLTGCWPYGRQISAVLHP